MSLRRSARVRGSVALADAITRPVAISSKPDQTIDKVEPNKVAKRGKSTKVSKATKAQKASETAVVEIPVTPKRKRNVTEKDAIPFTPTPSEARLMSKPHNPNAYGGTTPQFASDRPADPHHTNAPLFSPETSRVVSYAAYVENSRKPDKLDWKSAHTTGNILEEAKAHLLKVDSKLEPLIKKHHCRIFSPEGLDETIDPFEALASSIISQQVSGAAAKSIKNKFIALFNKGVADGTAHTFPAPSEVAACDLPTLRTAGLSGRKAEYIQGLAEKFASGELSTDMLVKASDEEVMEKLITVRGLGKWSVEMFACFGLKRMDVFSTGDLGVQRGVATYVGKDCSKLKAKGGKWKYMSEKDMVDVASKFAPYRSLFMWYMWRIEDVDVDAMQN